MNLPRRALLISAAAAAFLTWTGLQPARADAGDQAFVARFADRLVAIVNGPGSAPSKRPALAEAIDANVDVPTIARFCLGRFWAQATLSQQQQYVTLFHKVLLNNIAGHLGDYAGVRYRITGARASGGDQLVDTVIDRPQQQPIDVQWVVSHAGGAAMVIDVVAEGSSLRLTQRQDYASYLSRNGNSIDALLAALQRQLASAG